MLRMKPLPLKKLEALNARLPTNFPQRAQIEKEIARRYKGFIGEQKVDYLLKQLPASYVKLQDICLNVHGKELQIDTLIISSHAIYLIEVKNYDGTITFDTVLKQFIRHDGQAETGFRYPITQAERSVLNLKLWLSERSLPQLPIYYFIAISEPSTIIKVKGDEAEIANVVVHADYLLLKIIELDNELAAAGDEGEKDAINYTHNRSFETQMSGRNNRGQAALTNKIAAQITKETKDFDIDIVSQYKIKAQQLLPGVHCPTCKQLGMIRNKKQWYCKKCKQFSMFAHISALNDYFLLIHPWITNKKCMQFLGINCRHLAQRLLKSANLHYDTNKRVWKRK
ncbi:nuclease-related domain-containing protein [Virgibacillus sp. W0430]|uniref:nuclease-related domain-containing protein n=1 Tax=Virgibacillus sp. W0430 TaxID=3391580 RepID=UPI003F490502